MCSYSEDFLGRRDGLEYTAKLCVTLRLMSNPPGRGVREIVNWFYQVLGILAKGIFHDPSSRERTSDVSAEFMLMNITLEHRISAIEAVSALVSLVRDSVPNDYVNNYWRGSNLSQCEALRTLTDPIIDSASLHHVIKFSLPFEDSSALSLSTAHLATMTALDFLEAAEWIGIYTMSFPRETTKPDLPSPVRYDPPMQGIYFAAGIDTHQPHVVCVSGTGHDKVGEFNLDGYIHRLNGYVDITKTYSTGRPVWHWHGLMTPFGIVGTWGGRRQGGWVWLWKLPNEVGSS